MTGDPRLTDVRAALIHLEGVESALERAIASPVGPFDADDVGLTVAALFAGELRTSLEHAARDLDPLARDPLARRADEPRTPAGS